MNTHITSKVKIAEYKYGMYYLKQNVIYMLQRLYGTKHSCNIGAFISKRYTSFIVQY